MAGSGKFAGRQTTFFIAVTLAYAGEEAAIVSF
jgi:hypothetical protein